MILQAHRSDAATASVAVASTTAAPYAYALPTAAQAQAYAGGAGMIDPALMGTPQPDPAAAAAAAAADAALPYRLVETLLRVVKTTEGPQPPSSRQSSTAGLLEVDVGAQGVRWR